MKLISLNVEATFMDCLSNGNEDLEQAVVVEGLTDTYAFSKTRLDENVSNIASMLSQLPSFYLGGGSFLNICTDAKDRTWTSLHRHGEQLCLLGIAVGLAEWASSKETWHKYPGGVPWFKIKGGIHETASGC